MYQQKDADVGTARQEPKRRTKGETCGCSEPGHEDSWYECRRCRRLDEMEAVD